MELFFIPSPFGALQVVLKEEQLYSVSGAAHIKADSSFKSSYFIDETDSMKKKSRQNASKPSLLAKDLKKQFHFYFQGKPHRFELRTYKRGTSFQQKVWKAISKTAWGKVTTYSRLAQSIKNPKAFRAVGSCCAKNPFLIVVPCHRVLSKKNLGGFALGLDVKKQLLKIEKSKF